VRERSETSFSWSVCTSSGMQYQEVVATCTRSGMKNSSKELPGIQENTFVTSEKSDDVSMAFLKHVRYMEKLNSCAGSNLFC